MQPAGDFKGYCRNYFARLCRGYANALDDTLVRAWLYGHKNASDNGGAWDMSTRMFAALGAWLSDPKRPRRFELRHQAVDIEVLTKAVLEHAFDPDHPGFWGKEEFPARNQRTVESSMLAYGAWLLRDALLPKISERGIAHFQDWLAYFSSAPLAANNWNLFWIVNHAARKALGWEYDQAVLDEAWDDINGYEREDGWLTDGPECHFDDYNWWVFGTHEMFWMQMDGASDSALRARIAARTKKRLEVYPHFFGSDGSVSEYGRSLSYKFARLGCPILAYKLGLWPHSAGMLKRLIWRHLAFYDNAGAIDRVTDTVRQALSEFGHPAVRDSYINTGHPYWCMHAFVALWQLDEDDPIWEAEEEPLPVEQGDFRKKVRSAGWVLQGVKETGQVLRYSLGTQHGRGAYAAKYGKFVYGSHFPVNFGSAEGDFGPDAALCLTDGDHWAHPGFYEQFAVDEDYLRARYTLSVGQIEVPVETVLIPRGEWCIRVHRIAVPSEVSALAVIEGGSAAGYAPGTLPVKAVDAAVPYSLVRSQPRDGRAQVSLIYGLMGYTRAHRAQGFRGNEHLNGIHDRAITPVLEADLSDRAGETVLLACLTVTALAWDEAMLSQAADIAVSWGEDGTVRVAWEGLDVVVPALSDRAGVMRGDQG